MAIGILPFEESRDGQHIHFVQLLPRSYILGFFWCPLSLHPLYDRDDIGECSLILDPGEHLCGEHGFAAVFSSLELRVNLTKEWLQCFGTGQRQYFITSSGDKLALETLHGFR